MCMDAGLAPRHGLRRGPGACSPGPVWAAGDTNRQILLRPLGMKVVAEMEEDAVMESETHHPYPFILLCWWVA